MNKFIGNRNACKCLHKPKGPDHNVLYVTECPRGRVARAGGRIKSYENSLPIKLLNILFVIFIEGKLLYKEYEKPNHRPSKSTVTTMVIPT